MPARSAKHRGAEAAGAGLVAALVGAAAVALWPLPGVLRHALDGLDPRRPNNGLPTHLLLGLSRWYWLPRGQAWPERWDTPENDPHADAYYSRFTDLLDPLPLGLALLILHLLYDVILTAGGDWLGERLGWSCCQEQDPAVPAEVRRHYSRYPWPLCARSVIVQELVKKTERTKAECRRMLREVHDFDTRPCRLPWLRRASFDLLMGAAILFAHLRCLPDLWGEGDTSTAWEKRLAHTHRVAAYCTTSLAVLYHYMFLRLVSPGRFLTDADDDRLMSRVLTIGIHFSFCIGFDVRECARGLAVHAAAETLHEAREVVVALGLATPQPAGPGSFVYTISWFAALNFWNLTSVLPVTWHGLVHYSPLNAVSANLLVLGILALDVKRLWTIFVPPARVLQLLGPAASKPGTRKTGRRASLEGRHNGTSEEASGRTSGGTSCRTSVDARRSLADSMKGSFFCSGRSLADFVDSYTD